MRESLKVVNDQRDSPTYAVDLAKAVLQIIQLDNHRYGIYHYSNEGNITWYDFAGEIYRQGKRWNLSKKIARSNRVPVVNFRKKLTVRLFHCSISKKLKKCFLFLFRNGMKVLPHIFKELL